MEVKLMLPESLYSAPNIVMSDKKWEVTCPTCGRMLSVKDAQYHRCPVCGKVFQLSKGTIAKNEMQPLPEQPVPVKPSRRKARREKKAKWEMEMEGMCDAECISDPII